MYVKLYELFAEGKNIIYVTVVLDRSEKSKSIELAFVRERIRAVLHILHNR